MHRQSVHYKRGSAQDGFTLLEAAFALVMLMVIGLGMASLFTYAIQANSRADDRELAMAIAQKRMEWLRTIPFTTQTRHVAFSYPNGGLEVTPVAGVTETWGWPTGKAGLLDMTCVPVSGVAVCGVCLAWAEVIATVPRPPMWAVLCGSWIRVPWGVDVATPWAVFGSAVGDVCPVIGRAMSPVDGKPGISNGAVPARRIASMSSRPSSAAECGRPRPVFGDVRGGLSPFTRRR